MASRMKVRPTGLPEITMETSKRWGEVYYAIKLYFHEKYGALGDIIPGDIIPDIVGVGVISAYRLDLEVDKTDFSAAKLKASNDAGGILKEQYGALWRECEKANREYKKDRVSAFYVNREEPSSFSNPETDG
jgi:hypothetical protein